MTDILQGIEFQCTRCRELQPLSEYAKNGHGETRRTTCRTCQKKIRAAWLGKTYDPNKTDFRHSPHVDRPDMGLRYHLCDPVHGELVATAKTLAEARDAAVEYHHKRRVRIKFVEIYDEETLEVFHLTRPTKRYKKGIMRGPCEPALPDEQLRVGRGSGKQVSL